MFAANSNLHLRHGYIMIIADDCDVYWISQVSVNLIFVSSEAVLYFSLATQCNKITKFAYKLKSCKLKTLVTSSEQTVCKRQENVTYALNLKMLHAKKLANQPVLHSPFVLQATGGGDHHWPIDRRYFIQWNTPVCNVLCNGDNKISQKLP